MGQALEPTTTLVEPTRNRDEFAAKYKDAISLWNFKWQSLLSCIIPKYITAINETNLQIGDHACIDLSKVYFVMYCVIWQIFAHYSQVRTSLN
jgi:hypothetical protein